MSHSQFHCTGRVYLDLHGLIFETSICYWQDQPGSPRSPVGAGTPARTAPWERVAETDPPPPPAEARVSPGWLGGYLEKRRGTEAGQPRVTGGDAPALGRPGGVSRVGFEKHRVRRKARRARRVGSPRGATAEPRDGLRGRTARSDGASRSRYRAVGPGRSAEERSPRTPSAPGPSRAVEANPQAGGTVRPNTSARLAGGGPPMAGHVCQSVGGVDGKEPACGPGCDAVGSPDGAPRAWGTSPEVGRGRRLEAYVLENWVSDFVRRHAWRTGCNRSALLEANPASPRVRGEVPSNGPNSAPLVLPRNTVGGGPGLPEGPGRSRLQRSKNLEKIPLDFFVPLVLPSVSRRNTLGNPGETGAHRWRPTRLPGGPGRALLQRSKHLEKIPLDFPCPWCTPGPLPRGSGEGSPPTVETLRKNRTRFSMPLVLPSVSRWNTLGNPGETGAHCWRRTHLPEGPGSSVRLQQLKTWNTLGEPGATGAHCWRRTELPKGPGGRFASNG